MYQYRVYTFDRQIITGTIDASSEAVAEASLRKLGYNQILNIRKIHPSFNFRRLFSRSNDVKRIDLVELFQQMATLTESRMPVNQALWLLGEQSPGEALKNFINKLGRALSGGTSFSRALADYPRLVPAHYREVIKVSEQTGNLSAGLKLVAGYMEKEMSTSKNLARTLAYPAFLVAMAAVVISVLATVALPSLTRLFDSLGATLPLATRLLIALSRFITTDRLYLAAGLAGLIIFFLLFPRSETGKKLISRMVLGLPVIGQVVILRNVCRFCRNTAMLLEAGLTLPQCLNSVIGVVDNNIIKLALADVQRDLIKGKGLSQPMAACRIFPRLLVDMINIGEKTDTLQASFAAMADFYEKRLDQRVLRLLSLIEPASIIIVGLIISFIGLAIVTPIYSIYQTIQ
jgi:type IV pilus assembly protein PilC